MSSGFPFDLDTGNSDTSRDHRLSSAQAIELAARELATSAEGRRALTSRPEYWTGLNRNWEHLAADFHPGETDGYAEYLLALSRLTRNAVAGESKSQELAFVNEHHVRHVLHQLSSGIWLTEEIYFPHVRALTQLLSNVITANDSLSQKLWDTYCSLPGDHPPVLRLLYSRDIKTIIPTFVLVLNCTTGSVERTRLLPSSRTAVPLLDWIERVFDMDEDGDEGKVFQLGYAIFSNVFKLDLFDHVFESISIPSHPLPPAQLTLLKLYDSYLHSPSTTRSSSSTSSIASLVPCLLDLSAHIRHLREDERLELHVGQGVVLVTDLINESVLEDDKSERRELRDLLERSVGDDGAGVPESLIGLLRHLLSHAPPTPPLETIPNPDQPDALSYVNRAIVRLISTLAHGSRAVQDRVGAAGGIELILSMTTGDGRNPYLREHALFAVRNLLAGNIENQRRVQGLELQGAVDESGAITDLKIRGGAINGK